MRPTVREEDVEKMTELIDPYTELDAEQISISKRLQILVSKYEKVVNNQNRR